MISNPRTVSIPAVALVVCLTGSAALGQLEEAWKRLQRSTQSNKKSIAYFEIADALTETPSNLIPLFGSDQPESMKSLLERFKQARHDDNVVAVVIDLQEARLGLAQVEEIHEAVRKFSAADKEVYVHSDSLFTVNYVAATGASHISMVPTGDLWLTGFYGEQPFLREALDKLGVAADFESCGDFKTGPEPFTRNEPSENSKKMSNWLLDGAYEAVVARIAESRSMTAERVRALIDDGPYSAEDALKAGLIDSVRHRQELVESLQDRYGSGVEFDIDYAKGGRDELPEDFFSMFRTIMEALNPTAKMFSKPSVAIVYVEGLIQTGEAEENPFAPVHGAFSTTIRKALDEAAEESTVKAVVLRIDSPGGSALASEIILNASRRIAARKPLIVSMGNVAASGGYYVTCGAETLFADRNTITGSIGVFGGKFITTQAWDKLGIHWHANQRGAMAGMMGSAAPFNEKERAKLRGYMEEIYATFKDHVTDARGDRLTQAIEELAGGRVFTGGQALERGLVDKIGGLEDAIKFAAKRVGLSDYEVRVIPEPPGMLDLLFGRMHKDETIGIARPTDQSFLGLPFFRSMLEIVGKIDPLRARAVTRMVQRLDIIQEEGVVLMMPSEYLIR